MRKRKIGSSYGHLGDIHLHREEKRTDNAKDNAKYTHTVILGGKVVRVTAKEKKYLIKTGQNKKGDFYIIPPKKIGLRKFVGGIS